MRRYAVTFIERSGRFAKYMVFAHNKGEAKRLAEEHDCEDIKHVRHVGLLSVPFIIVCCAIVLIVGIVCYIWG